MLGAHGRLWVSAFWALGGVGGLVITTVVMLNAASTFTKSDSTLGTILGTGACTRTRTLIGRGLNRLTGSTRGTGTCGGLISLKVGTFGSRRDVRRAGRVVGGGSPISRGTVGRNTCGTLVGTVRYCGCSRLPGTGNGITPGFGNGTSHI